MKTKILVLATTVLASSFALADDVKKGGLFVEPMITYERGEGDVKFPDPFGKADTDVNGFGVGARVGFHILESVFIGADGRYSMPTFKAKRLDQDVDSKAWNYGPVVGVQMPTALGLRVWGGYILDGQLDPDKDAGVDQKFRSANGYRVGAGVKLGIVSLNLEYQDMKYDKTDVSEVGVFTPGYSSNKIELNNSSWILSASFPIAL